MEKYSGVWREYNSRSKKDGIRELVRTRSSKRVRARDTER